MRIDKAAKRAAGMLAAAINQTSTITPVSAAADGHVRRAALTAIKIDIATIATIFIVDILLF
jgi:hypothetical protein